MRLLKENPQRRTQPGRETDRSRRKLSLRSKEWNRFEPDRRRISVPGSLLRTIRQNGHRGFTIVEMLATCLLLGILFSMTIPMLLLVARERHSTEQRQFALQHVANLLEQATTQKWADLKPGELPLPEPDADLQLLLPGLERSLVVKASDDDTDSRQLSASIRWQNKAGDFVSPIRLSTWVQATKEVP
jgi:prepilin-type N-terminal cleavage/methylation domain-containing protein